MATSKYNVDLRIGSNFGFRRPARDLAGAGARFITAPYPLATTTVYLDGDIASFDVAYNPTIKSFEYTTFTDFISYPFQFSPAQLFTLTNNSLSTVTFGVPSSNFLPLIPSAIGASTFPIPVGTLSTDTSGRMILSPGESATFSVRYYAESVGVYNNSIAVFSDVGGAQVKVLTRQVVLNTASFVINPGNFNTVSNTIGETNVVSYVLDPIVNGQVRDDIFVFDTAIDPDGPWRIISNENNEIVLRFKNNDVNNLNGTYTSYLTISFEGYVYTATNTCTIAIDYTQNKNIGTWMSPKAPINSVIGISYDLINGQKTLTIGVGTGDESEGVPEYASGGSSYLDIRGIGVGADKLDVPYPHWKEVYRFTNLGTGTAATYFSGNIDQDGFYMHKVKPVDTALGRVLPHYGQYFGDQSSRGSMFILHDDGTGNVRISLNQLREYSSSTSLNQTLDNLTRAFHYYSEADIPNRIENLVQYPINTSTTYPATTSTVPIPLGENRTNLFLGLKERFENKKIRSGTTSSLVLYNNDYLTLGMRVRGSEFTTTATVTNFVGTDTVEFNIETGIPLTTGSIVTFYEPDKYHPDTSIVVFPK